MVLNRLAWDSIVSAAAERQPYVELRKSKEKAVRMDRSILLDYRSYASLISWAFAFKNRHWFLGICMVLNQILSIFIIPIAAYLFSPATLPVHSNISVNIVSAFNVSLLTTETDAQPAINEAGAVLVHRATPPPYITSEYAFEPLSNISIQSGNVTAAIDGFSGYISCELKTSDANVYRDGNLLFIDMNDRGCRIPTQRLPLSNGSSHLELSLLDTIFARTFSTDTCSNKAHNSRIGLLAGGFPNNNTNAWNVTAISCIPSFWKTHGNLTVTLQSSIPSRFEFHPVPANSTEIDATEYQALVRGLPAYQAFDPTGRFYTDVFGRAVFGYAQKLNSNTEPSVLNSTTLIESMERTFAAMFAFLTGTALFESTEKRELRAVQSINVTKLFVVRPVAYTVTAAQILVALCNVYLIWYIERYPSCLGDEPRGWLRIAAMIQKSDLVDVVARIQRRYPESDKIEDTVRKQYTWKECRAYYNESKERVVVENLEEIMT
ncbi:uncharacterized protein BDR25DRAFT_386584 [Lindgomyces ingoldianus]|uniref:Uncharacterized protein n=1 Tax=Lindgomyces ingoldianus TaxID=673940 RepID=A0ACB6R4M8_9PLEO|nr:uncharacterized protein BDR25DRAFT_386584 [Lindgomyces ingoldianus]KAF2473725.1 hypothetical protein BDR25DRAFT_386584 [Lindgomyces ingoldianus]